MPDEVLSKEFLNQVQTEADVSKFLEQLHAQVLEKMLEGEMDAHWVMRRIRFPVITAVIPVTAATKKIQTEHGEAVIPIPVTVTVNSIP